jgi:hypothetical protein
VHRKNMYEKVMMLVHGNRKNTRRVGFWVKLRLLETWEN